MITLIIILGVLVAIGVALLALIIGGIAAFGDVIIAVLVIVGAYKLIKKLMIKHKSKN